MVIHMQRAMQTQPVEEMNWDLAGNNHPRGSLREIHSTAYIVFVFVLHTPTVPKYQHTLVNINHNDEITMNRSILSTFL